MASPLKVKVIKSYCQRCDLETNHEVLFSKDEIGNPEEYAFRREYMVLSCLGCENISFRDDFHDIEQNFPTEEGDWQTPVETEIYPYFLRKHKELEGLHLLPYTISIVYKESIKALASNCRILAGAGFRAVIEAVCLDKDIKGGNLEAKINNLQKNGLITKNECARLHSVRFIGNDSIHEIKTPQIEQLYVVLNIIDHLLENLYLLDHSVDIRLEKPISKFHELERLINKNLRNFLPGEELPLFKILGKDHRRIDRDVFVELENTLVKEIGTAEFKGLTLGSSKPIGNSSNKIQHYIINEIPAKPLDRLMNR